MFDLSNHGWGGPLDKYVYNIRPEQQTSLGYVLEWINLGFLSDNHLGSKTTTIHLKKKKKDFSLGKIYITENLPS